MGRRQFTVRAVLEPTGCDDINLYYHRILLTVTDPQGAVIGGADVELKNPATNVSRTTTTNDSGLYRFDAVDLGTYDLVIRAKNFKTIAGKTPGTTYGDWAKIANDGAAAAGAKNTKGVKDACKACHDKYKKMFKDENRDMAFP